MGKPKRYQQVHLGTRGLPPAVFQWKFERREEMGGRVAWEIKFIGFIFLVYSGINLFSRLQSLVSASTLRGGLGGLDMQVLVLALLFLGGLGLLRLKGWGRALFLIAALIKLFLYLKPPVAAYLAQPKHLSMIIKNLWPDPGKFVFTYLILLIIFLCPSVKEEFE